MKIEINVQGQTYYKSCSKVCIWMGSLKDAPDWIVEAVEDNDAMVHKHKTITIKHKNGYAVADPGDIIIKDGECIEVWRVDK